MLKQLISIFLGTIVIGIPMAVLMMAAVLLIPTFTLEAAYDVALFIPDKLGLVAEVESSEIVAISGSGDTIINLPRSGRYRIYSAEPIAANTRIDLLSQKDARMIEVVSLYEQTGVGQLISVEEPQFVFTLDEPGTYTVKTSAVSGVAVPDDIAFSIEPYVGNRQATVAVIGGIVQIVLLAFGISSAYQWLNRERLQAEKAAKVSSREQWEAFMDKEKHRTG